MPRFPKTAEHARGLSDRVFSKLASRAAKMPGPIYPLHVGDTWLEPFEAARAEAQRASRIHTYSPVQGEPELLSAITAHLQKRGDCLIDRECLQVTSGATAGLSVVSEALLEPGDEVLLPSPFWPLIRGILQKRGTRPVEIPFYTRLNEPGFDAEKLLEAAITPRTAAVYVNSPHNPTGAMLSDEVLAAIARVAERHDLWILCDEVYEEVYFYGPPPPTWQRADFQRRSVAVHSMSKAFGLAGARVGWAHGPHEAMEVIRGVQTFSTYCASRPMQLGAARALAEGSAWLDRARNLYCQAAIRTADALGIEAPAGGTFAFVDVGKHLREGEDTLGFLERCLEAGVLLTPGSASGKDYERWVRVCFTCIPPEELDKALVRLRPLFASK
jgi:N-succinyldiaminopimelate aminotransferase